MKAVPVETINKIIANIKSEMAIELLKAIVDTHAVEVSNTKENYNFLNLVERIRAIDPKAADWIIEYQNIVDMNKDAADLRNLFPWFKATQGEGYWKEISEKLGE